MAKMEKVVIILLLISCTLAVKLGGWKELKTDDNEVQTLAKSALDEVDLRSNSMYRNKMVKLEKAEVQVVAGMKYRLVLDVTQSDCKKSDPNVEVEKCGLSDENVQRCVISFWVQPWLKSQTIDEFSCQPMGRLRLETQKPQTPPLLGGGSDADPTSKEALEAALFAVDQMNAKSNNLRKMVLMDVKHVQKQTVAGIKWRMVLEVGQSSCLNGHKASSNAVEDCSPQKGQSDTCSVDVLEQKWSDKRFTLLSDKCTKSPAQNKPDAGTVVVMDQKPPILGGDGHDIGHHGDFLEFKAKYNRVYANTKEEVKRFHIFRTNMKKAAKLQETEKGTATYGVTKFADMSAEEFRENYLTPVWDVSLAQTMDKAVIPTLETVPKTWDWREHNAVTPVKNQGMCGSCWAFSTTGNIEGQWALKKGTLLSLSEQELVDCDKVDQGCNGGLPTNAYKAIEKLGGLESEKEYPYEGKGEKCEYTQREAVAYINNSVSISSNEADMKTWLYKNGPISIGINANAMQYYTGGVSHPWSLFCNPESLDHGVLIVGYGSASGWFSPTPFWTVKNSWGPDWGEKGYYRVYRGKGVCGLNKMPTSAVVE